MQLTQPENTLKQDNRTTFDGLVVEKSGAEGPNLDLRTLNEKTKKFPNHQLVENLEKVRSAAFEYGMTETGNGRGWVFTVRAFTDNGYEVSARSTEEGHKKTNSRRLGEKPKKRATDRSQMSEESIVSSLRRTKKQIRQQSRMMCANLMLTFTTRHAYVDVDQFKRVTSRFLAMVRKEHVDFQYISVFERHNSNKTSSKKKGSLHMHMVTAGYVPYNPLRELWKKAVQLDLKNGDWEGASMQASEAKNRSPSTLARYISKYLTKDLDNEHFEPNKKRYWSSKNIQVPPLITLFSPPAAEEGIFRAMWGDILEAETLVFFAPEVEPGKPPIIWMSSA